MQILIFGGAALFVALILLVVGLTRNPTGQELVERRLGEAPQQEAEPDERERRSESIVGAAVDRAVEGRGFAENLATLLAQANLKWTVGEFLAMSFIIGVAVSLVFYVLNRPVLIPVGLILGFLGPRIYLTFRKNARLKEFNDQLGDALNLMVNSLRAGYSTMQALEVISNEMPAPISEEFRRVVLELQLGVPFDTAMSNLLRRMPSADMDLIITAMSVQREVGGNLAEVLDAISFTIRERVRIKGEIKTLTAQGRITGVVITILPIGLGIVLYMVNPGFIGLLFESACGWLMVGLAVILIVIGYVMVNKIVSIEV